MKRMGIDGGPYESLNFLSQYHLNSQYICNPTPLTDGANAAEFTEAVHQLKSLPEGFCSSQWLSWTTSLEIWNKK